MTGPIEQIFANGSIPKVLDVFIDGKQCTAEDVVKATGLSIRTVRDALHHLKDKKILSLVDKRGRFDVYRLNDSDTVERLRQFAYRASNR